MLCENCNKREATVIISTAINGIKTQKRLCAECAEKENTMPFFNIGADSLFSGFFGDSVFSARGAGEQKRCSVCGQSRRELAKSGRAGCAKCYEVFSDELDRIIHGIHGSAQYTGTLPGKHSENAEIRKKIQELKNEQQAAISEQNYERAAELRDEIKALENGKGDN